MKIASAMFLIYLFVHTVFGQNQIQNWVPKKEFDSYRGKYSNTCYNRHIEVQQFIKNATEYEFGELYRFPKQYVNKMYSDNQFAAYKYWISDKQIRGFGPDKYYGSENYSVQAQIINKYMHLLSFTDKHTSVPKLLHWKMGSFSFSSNDKKCNNPTSAVINIDMQWEIYTYTDRSEKRLAVSALRDGGEKVQYYLVYESDSWYIMAQYGFGPIDNE